MQKYERTNTLNMHHKCQICLQQVNSDCLLTDVAHYSPQTNNLAMVSKLACRQCRQEVSTIRQYVEQNGLNFSKNSTIFKESIEHLIPKQNIPRVIDESQIYLKNIQQQIKRNKLYYCAKLPQNCLQLVYYSSISINHAQRHERIRNAIKQVMRLAPIPLGNLQDVSILVHCLSCYMHENNVILLIKYIAERMLIEGSPLPPVSTDSDLPYQRIWRQLYSCGYIGNILTIISQMLKGWKTFNSYFEQIKIFHGYLKQQKTITIQNQIQQSPTLKKNSALFFQSNQNQCRQCIKYRKQFLLSQAQMKNTLALTLKSLLLEDAAHREHVKQLQIKFMKEKDQFINKIIKLKDRIETLEKNDQEEEVDIKRSRSLSEFQVRRGYKKTALEQVQEKSQGTIRTVQVKDKNQQAIKTFETDKNKEGEYLALQCLQKLVVNLPQFDPSMLSNDYDYKQLFQKIDKQLKKMREEVDKLEKKNKSLDNQSKRLLSILTRHQERFIPLIHEKDEIIQKYQNALWKMQRGLVVQDPVLAPRITNIINVFKSDFLESMSNGTIQSDINYEQMSPQISPDKTKTSKKKKDKDKDKQKQKSKTNTDKKVKSTSNDDKEKECNIF